MTRLEAEPTIGVEPPTRHDGPRSLLLEAREVPLGGVRAMQVHRALPQRDLPTVGAWCFLDRFGPQTTRMRVDPHPHIGLQTVTWPFVGAIRHRDSLGSDIVIHRGELNLMTAGEGVSHSEYSTSEQPAELDALQLWIALPESRRHGAPAFERHESLPEFELPALAGRPAYGVVVMGEFAGVASPATTFSPLAGVELRVPPGCRVRLPLHAEWEYAIAHVDGDVRVASGSPGRTAVAAQQVLYLGAGRDGIEIESREGSTVFLLGGEPFDDELVMWWNFVGRSHEEILEARNAWEARAPRFGRVVDHGDERIPAPPLPAVRLTRRRRRL